MTSKSLEIVKAEAIEHSGVIRGEANVLVIHNRDGLEYASELMKQAKDQMRVIEAGFKEHKENAWKSHKALCASENEALAPFKSITNILKPKMLKYQADLDAAALKVKQEAERKQRVIEAAVKQKAEQEKAKHAEALMDHEDYEKAEDVIEAPTIVPVAAIVPEVKEEKVKGAGTAKRWKARVIDFSKVDDKFKNIDQTAADQMAKICKDKSKEPGLEFYQETYLTGK